MATDSGTAKAKEISKDNSPVEREVRDDSSSISRDRNISTQKDNSIPVQTQNPSNTGTRDLSSIPAQKDNTSSVGQNSSAAPQTNSPSSAQCDSFTTRNSSTSDNLVSVSVNSQDDRLHSKLNKQVAKRAYELYQQSGADHGDDLFHWLQAECELLTRISEIRQAGSSFTVIAPLEGFTPEEMSVIVEPNRALILADKQQASDGNDSQESQISSKSAFFVADWPDEIEPSTATAQLRQSNLVLTVKRANGTSQNARAAGQ